MSIATTADKIMAVVESPQEPSSSEFDQGKIVRILTEIQGAINNVNYLDNARSLVSQNAQTNTMALTHLSPSLPGPFDPSTSVTVPETQQLDDVDEFEALLRSTEVTDAVRDDKPSAKPSKGRKVRDTTAAGSRGDPNNSDKENSERNKNTARNDNNNLEDDDKGDNDNNVWTFSQPSGGGIQPRTNRKATSRSKKRR